MSRSLLAVLSANNRHLVLLRGNRPPLPIPPHSPDTIPVCINRNTAEALVESGDLPASVLADEPALTATA